MSADETKSCIQSEKRNPILNREGCQQSIDRTDFLSPSANGLDDFSGSHVSFFIRHEKGKPAEQFPSEVERAAILNSLKNFLKGDSCGDDLIHGTNQRF